MSTDTAPDLSSVSVIVVGGGTMGGAFVTAALAAGVEPGSLRIANASEESSREAAERLGATAGSVEDVAGADVVVLGVKPYQLDAVLPQIAEALGEDTLVVSLAAGATLATLREALSGHEGIVRAMPNTPMSIGEGVTALMAADGATDAQRALARALLSASGLVEEIAEDKVHAMIGASGSGVAFLFYVMEAMIDEAVRQGLTRDLATRVVEQTVRGAAGLVQDSGENPALARAAVCSPGGTTAEGIAALDRAGIRPGLASAMEAAAAKSRALAGE